MTNPPNEKGIMNAMKSMKTIAGKDTFKGGLTPKTMAFPSPPVDFVGTAESTGANNYKKKKKKKTTSPPNGAGMKPKKKDDSSAATASATTDGYIIATTTADDQTRHKLAVIRDSSQLAQDRPRQPNEVGGADGEAGQDEEEQEERHQEKQVQREKERVLLVHLLLVHLLLVLSIHVVCVNLFFKAVLDFICVVTAFLFHRHCCVIDIVRDSCTQAEIGKTES